MKKLIYIFLISLVFITGCGTEEEKEAISYKEISAIEAHNIMQESSEALIIDVRTPEEFNAGHIKNAINLPVTEIGDRFKESVTDNLNAKILVYCKSGARAKQASELLVDLGYSDVSTFGGITDWPYDIVTD